MLEGRVIQLGDGGQFAWRPSKVAHYPHARGRRVQVAYDPASPAHSVLEPGVPAAMWLYVFMAAACLIVDFLLLVRHGG